MEVEGSLLPSQEPVTGPYHEPDESSLLSHVFKILYFPPHISL
jgi:hypothetical protein